MNLDRHLSIAILLASSASGWMHSGMGEKGTSSVPALARSPHKAQLEAKTWPKPFSGPSCNPCTTLCKPSRSACLIHLITHSPAHSCIRSPTHSLTHSLARSLTHSLTHSLARSLAHSPTLLHSKVIAWPLSVRSLAA